MDKEVLNSRAGQETLREYYDNVKPALVPVDKEGNLSFDLPFSLGKLGEAELREIHPMIGLTENGVYGDDARRELNIVVNGLFDEMFMSPEDRAYSRACRNAEIKGLEKPTRTEQLIAEEMHSDSFEDYNVMLDGIKNKFGEFRKISRKNYIDSDSINNMMKQDAVEDVANTAYTRKSDPEMEEIMRESETASRKTDNESSITFRNW